MHPRCVKSRQVRSSQALNANEGHERKVAVKPFAAAWTRFESHEGQSWHSKVMVEVLTNAALVPCF